VSGNIVRTQAPTGDWQLTTLGEVCVLQRRRVDPDQMHPASLLEHWSIPALDEFGGPAEEPAGSIGSHKFLLAEDCVLLSLLNPRIPRHAIAAGGENVICSTEFAAMVPGAQLSLSFLNCLVSASGFVGRFVNLAQGTTKSRERVRPAEFLALQMTLPPLAEQRRIVDVVGAVDDCVEALDAQLAATRTLRGGVLAELLSSPGDDWRTATLQNLTEFTIGGVWGSEPGGSEVDVPVYRQTEFDDFGRLAQPAGAVRSVPKRQLERRTLRPGDVLIQKVGGTPRLAGRVVRVPELPELSTFSNFINVLRPYQEKILPDYYFLLLHHLNKLRVPFAFQRGSTFKNLDLKSYLQTEVQVPPMAEQRRIVEVVGAMDAQVAALEIQAAVTRTLRAGVLSELLSGKRLLDESYDQAAGL